jgi:hypothetical protein
MVPTLGVVQSAFYVGTGVWPLLSYRTFIAVTGPKRDDWLVKSVGLVIAVVGSIVGFAFGRRRAEPEMTVLAAGSAAALAAIDVVYVSRGRISRVYLLDALAEIALLAAWGFAWMLRAGMRPRRIGRRVST